MCQNFVSAENFRTEWVLEDLKAAEKEKIDGRCVSCWADADKMHKDLEEAVKCYEEIRLYKTIEGYRDKHDQIEITFLNKCKELKHKLELQNEILAYIKSLAKIDNYKVILKSVNKIQKMLKDAAPFNIDQDVIDRANLEIERLNAERNLRFEIDNIDTSVGTVSLIQPPGKESPSSRKSTPPPPRGASPKTTSRSPMASRPK